MGTGVNQVWSQSIKDKVDRYIDVMFADHFKSKARQEYSVKDRITASILMEWHEHPRCPIFFDEKELTEIREAASRW